MSAGSRTRARRALRTGARLFAFVLAAGCAKTPVPPGERPTPSTSASSAPSASSAAAGAPRWLGDGCHAGVGVEGSARERLARVSAACAPGAKALGEPQALAGSGEARFSLPAAGCLRVFAVAERADSDVSLELLDTAGRSRAKDELPGSIALGGTHGPVCFEAAGEISAKVGLRAGSGTVVVSAALAE